MHSVPLGPLTVADPEVEGDTETVKLSAFSDPTVTLDVDSANDVVVGSGWMVSDELLEVDPASAEVPPNEAVIELEPTASWSALREHEPTPLVRDVEHSAPVGPLTVAAPEVEGDTEMVKVSAFSDPKVTVEGERVSDVVDGDPSKFVTRSALFAEPIHWATVREKGLAPLFALPAGAVPDVGPTGTPAAEPSVAGDAAAKFVAETG